LSSPPTTYHLPPTVFAGRLPEPDLIAAYHACDLFCLPSTTIAEAFGMVLLEAMACGKPLVTTRLPTGVSEVNQDGVTGLQVPPGDAPALRDAIGALLKDESRRKVMGEAARQRQAADYSATLMGERFVKLYNELA
jgi:glycosyltransferase involved in cell wall biosynthesis